MGHVVHARLEPFLRRAQLGVVEALAATPVPVSQLEQQPVLEGPALDRLRLAAEADVARVATAAIEGDRDEIPLRRPPRTARRPQPERRRDPDALDRLLEEMP